MPPEKFNSEAQREHRTEPPVEKVRVWTSSRCESINLPVGSTVQVGDGIVARYPDGSLHAWYEESDGPDVSLVTVGAKEMEEAMTLAKQGPEAVRVAPDTTRSQDIIKTIARILNRPDKIVEPEKK